MNKIYIYLPLIFIFLISCQKEELLLPDEMQENIQIGSEKMPYISLPEYIKNIFPKELSLSKKAGENRKLFGNMRKDIPASKIKNKTGQVSYTIALEKISGNSQSLYFDNVVITELEQDIKKYTVLHYLPKAEWFNSSQRNVKDYSGTIEFYTLAGEFLGKLVLINGEGIKELEVNKGYSTNCTYTHDKTLCTGETTMDGDVHGDLYSCDFYFTESCTTTYTNDSPTTTEETIEQGESGGGGGGIATTPIPDEEEEEILFEEKIDDSNLDYCLQSILNILKGHNHGIGKMLAKFDGNDAKYNWIVESANLSSDGSITGQTDPPSAYDRLNGSITSKFDSQQHSAATDLSWARTILHESAHAYLATYYATARPSWIASYSDMVEDWSNLQNWNDVHHEEFARSLVTDIALILKEFGQFKGYNLSDDFYIKLAWGGLEGTSSFDALSNKNEIRDIIRIELTGKNTNGYEKPQNGTNAGCKIILTRS